MAEAITQAVVELARYAFLAYAVKQGREVLSAWIARMPNTPTKQDVIDQARAFGLEIQERQA
jgi:hypothetical protein